MKYTVNMRDDQSSETIVIESNNLGGAWALAEAETEDWCRGGDWGDKGASVECWYSINGTYTKEDLASLDAAIDAFTDVVPDGWGGASVEDIKSGWIVDSCLPPALLAVAKSLAAARKEIVDEIRKFEEERSVTVEIEPCHEHLIKEAAGTAGCGTSPDDHDWTSEGEGGCSENPGVWSTGGTSMRFATHCRVCGLKRVQCTTGSQRNPGEHDTVEYEMLDSDAIDRLRDAGHMDDAE